MNKTETKQSQTPLQRSQTLPGLRAVLAQTVKKTSLKMTPTESNFYIKIFGVVLACVFGTKTMTKQNRELKFNFFLSNTQPIRNFERILAQ